MSVNDDFVGGPGVSSQDVHKSGKGAVEMRATLSDVVKHPSWFGGWWADWPVRRKHFWRTLLWEEGQGWLRWATDERTEYEYIDEGLSQPTEYAVAPPLRRLWWWVRAAFQMPIIMFIGYKHPGDDRRTRLSFEECRPSRSDLSYYRDSDRKRELWQHR